MSPEYLSGSFLLKSILEFEAGHAATTTDQLADGMEEEKWR